MRLGIWTCVSSWGPLALGHFRTAWIPARHQQFSSRNSHGEDPNCTQLVPINNTAAEVTGTHEPLHHVKVLICCRSKLEMLFVLNSDLFFDGDVLLKTKENVSQRKHYMTSMKTIDKNTMCVRCQQTARRALSWKGWIRNEKVTLGDVIVL